MGHNSTMSGFVTRFAPSPSGLLHLGHAFSALCAFNAAQQHSGHFVLRIEDIDTTRCRSKFEHALIDDLHWLGLSWEHPVRRQSEHFNDYGKSLDRLRKLGVLYRCFKTRREIMSDIARAPHEKGKANENDNTLISEDEEAALIASGAPFAWRLSLNKAREVLGAQWTKLHFFEEGSGPDGETGEIMAQPDNLGDVVLARKDINTSYHLSVVHDDALQGITHIVRGQDLFESTHIHVLLQALLRLPTPVYCHHNLITGDDGKRLAKRNHAATLQDLRRQGLSPDDVRQLLHIRAI